MKRPHLDRALTLQATVRTPDGAGGFGESWDDLGTLWGEVSPRNARETSGAAGPVSVAAFRISVRTAPVGATNRPVPGQRFVMGGRVFRILGVTEHPYSRRYLRCETREEVAS